MTDRIRLCLILTFLALIPALAIGAGSQSIDYSAPFDIGAVTRFAEQLEPIREPVTMVLIGTGLIVLMRKRPEAPGN